jgi:TetR/AcrR family transcriptional regulator
VAQAVSEQALFGGFSLDIFDLFIYNLTGWILIEEEQHMQEPGSKPGRKRVYDAQRTRAAILDAAEALFAEHGFDGVSVDAIATEAGYNKSLIFQYFGDKIGLYTEVVKRADRELMDLLAPVLVDVTIVTNAHAFKAFLETLVRAFFDYLVDHPRFMRTLLWEQAKGWQTYARIAAQLTPEHADQFEDLFRSAYNAGLLRSDFVPFIQLSMVLQMCLSYLSFIPLYGLAPHQDKDLGSAAALAHAREYIVAFVVHGMMIDLPETSRRTER